MGNKKISVEELLSYEYVIIYGGNKEVNDLWADLIVHSNKQYKTEISPIFYPKKVGPITLKVNKTMMELLYSDKAIKLMGSRAKNYILKAVDMLGIGHLISRFPRSMHPSQLSKFSLILDVENGKKEFLFNQSTNNYSLAHFEEIINWFSYLKIWDGKYIFITNESKETICDYFKNTEIANLCKFVESYKGNLYLQEKFFKNNEKVSNNEVSVIKTKEPKTIPTTENGILMLIDFENKEPFRETKWVTDLFKQFNLEKAFITDSLSEAYDLNNKDDILEFERSNNDEDYLILEGTDQLVAADQFTDELFKRNVINKKEYKSLSDRIDRLPKVQRSNKHLEQPKINLSDAFVFNVSLNNLNDHLNEFTNIFQDYDIENVYAIDNKNNYHSLINQKNTDIKPVTTNDEYQIAILGNDKIRVGKALIDFMYHQQLIHQTKYQELTKDFDSRFVYYGYPIDMGVDIFTDIELQKEYKVNRKNSPFSLQDVLEFGIEFEVLLYKQTPYYLRKAKEKDSMVEESIINNHAVEEKKTIVPNIQFNIVLGNPEKLLDENLNPRSTNNPYIRSLLKYGNERIVAIDDNGKEYDLSHTGNVRSLISLGKRNINIRVESIYKERIMTNLIKVLYQRQAIDEQQYQQLILHFEIKTVKFSHNNLESVYNFMDIDSYKFYEIDKWFIDFDAEELNPEELYELHFFDNEPYLLTMKENKSPIEINDDKIIVRVQLNNKQELLSKTDTGVRAYLLPNRFTRYQANIKAIDEQNKEYNLLVEQQVRSLYNHSGENYTLLIEGKDYMVVAELLMNFFRDKEMIDVSLHNEFIQELDDYNFEKQRKSIIEDLQNTSSNEGNLDNFSAIEIDDNKIIIQTKLKNKEAFVDTKSVRSGYRVPLPELLRRTEATAKVIDEQNQEFNLYIAARIIALSIHKGDNFRIVIEGEDKEYVAEVIMHYLDDNKMIDSSILDEFIHKMYWSPYLYWSSYEVNKKIKSMMIDLQTTHSLYETADNPKELKEIYDKYLDLFDVADELACKRAIEIGEMYLMEPEDLIPWRIRLYELGDQKSGKIAVNQLLSGLCSSPKTAYSYFQQLAKRNDLLGIRACAAYHYLGIGGNGQNLSKAREFENQLLSILIQQDIKIDTAHDGYESIMNYVNKDTEIIFDYLESIKVITRKKGIAKKMGDDRLLTICYNQSQIEHIAIKTYVFAKNGFKNGFIDLNDSRFYRLGGRKCLFKKEEEVSFIIFNNNQNPNFGHVLKTIDDYVDCVDDKEYSFKNDETLNKKVNEYWDLYDEGKYDEVYQEVLPLAKRGHLKALNMVGLMFYYGNGAPFDIVKAHQWFTIGINHDYKACYINMGNLYYFYSKDETEGHKKAYSYYKVVADTCNRGVGKRALEIVKSGVVPYDKKEVQLFKNRLIELGERQFVDGFEEDMDSIKISVNLINKNSKDSTRRELKYFSEDTKVIAVNQNNNRYNLRIELEFNELLKSEEDHYTIKVVGPNKEEDAQRLSRSLYRDNLIDLEQYYDFLKSFDSIELNVTLENKSCLIFARSMNPLSNLLPHLTTNKTSAIAFDEENSYNLFSDLETALLVNANSKDYRIVINGLNKEMVLNQMIKFFHSNNMIDYSTYKNVINDYVIRKAYYCYEYDHLYVFKDTETYDQYEVNGENIAPSIRDELIELKEYRIHLYKNKPYHISFIKEETNDDNNMSYEEALTYIDEWIKNNKS